MKLGAKYSWFPERGENGEWIGVVFEVRRRNLVVLTCGCELTEPEINRWCREQMDLIHRTGNREADVPDMHDRAKRAH